MEAFFYKVLWALQHILGPLGPEGIERLRLSFYKSYAKKVGFKRNEIRQVPEFSSDQMDRFFLEKVQYHQPLVFRGALKSTTCVSKWTLEYFKKTFGDQMQPIADSKDYFFYKEKQKISSIIDNIQSDNPEVALAFGDLMHTHPSLINDVEMEKWLNTSSFEKALNKTWLIFITAAGKWTKLHTEFNNTLSLQIKGKKRWMIFSPEQSLHVHPLIEGRNYLNSTYFKKLSDPEAQNLSLSVYDVTLEAGDVLYCPSFAWHSVECLETSISVGFKWSSWKTFLRYPLMSFIILTARNPSFLEKFIFSRNNKDFHPPKG